MQSKLRRKINGFEDNSQGDMVEVKSALRKMQKII